MINFRNIIIFVFHINSILTFTPPDILRRFEYKLSFKGPHLVFKDGTIPFWEHGGSTIPSNDQIRITPSLRSQKGRVWSNHKMTNPDWEIELFIRVTGRGRIGADGMAIWYTEEKGSEGPVFGSSDKWQGLGIFLDSFDNDFKQNNPYILAMTNDGTKTFEHNRDGITQQLGGCLRDFRNKPFPVRMKIEYYKRTLTISYHNGMSNDANAYEICTMIENVILPANGYFGVSAATGGLADDHDVLSFVTHSLIDQKLAETPAVVEENKKYDKEYEKFVKQLEEEKEKYNREHPEKVEEVDEKKVYEGENDRQFRLILDVQNMMHNSLRLLDSKLAEVLGRQERIVSLISAQQLQTQQQPQAQAQVPQIDTFRRDEVNLVMNQQNELVRSIRDIYNSVLDVHRKTNQLHERPLPQQLPAHQTIDPYQYQQLTESLKSIRQDIANAPKPEPIKCPELPNCLTSFYFTAFVVIQTAFLLVYFILKSRSESQAKKFY